MKISNDPLTLSPQLSQYVRALAHAAGCSDLNEIVNRAMFAASPSNTLECLAQDMEEDSQEWHRRKEAEALAKDAGSNWDEFVKVAEKMPPFPPR